MTRKNIIYPFLLILLVLPAGIPLLTRGFFEPHDLHHLGDIYEMARAIGSGQVPPRLGPDFSFGYGYPLFNFYYLLPFYAGATFFFISGSLITSFKFVFLLSAVVSVWGMYLFLGEFVKKLPAFVGSVLFLYTPYRAVQIYVRGAMGEVFFLALLPLVVWGLARIIRQPNNKRLVALTSLISGLFILSHNYLWILSLPALAFLALLLIERRKLTEALKSLFLVAFTALGISAFWWLPGLIEKKFVSSATPFPLIDHFPFIKQLIVPSWGYGASVWGPGDEMSFQIGIVNLLIFILVLLLLFMKRKIFENRIWKITIWAAGGFFVSFLFMNIRTYPVWKLLPFHDFIQFPWRLLIFTTFFTSILAAILVEVVGDKKRLFGGLIIILSILFTFSYFNPSQLFHKTDDEYLARIFADRSLSGKKVDVSKEYLNWSEDYLLLPNWTSERPKSLPDSKIETEDGSIEGISEINPVHWRAEVSSKKDTKLTFHSYYFPGWFAKLDGKKLEITPGKPYGQIEALIPQGKHTVEFLWKETTFRKFANFLSLASLLLVLTLLFGKNLRKAEAAK